MTDRPDADPLFVAPGPGAPAEPEPEVTAVGSDAFGARWGAPGGPTPQERAAARRRARLWVASVLGVVALVVGIAAGVSYAVSTGQERAWAPVAALPDAPTTVNAVQLVLGSCLDAPPSSGPVGRVEVVPCADDHDAQVVGRTDAAPREVWPGADAVLARAARMCTPELLGPAARAGQDDVSLVVWTPSEDSWSAGDRTSLCVARLTPSATGSLLE
ncbi:hypothetical protein GCM10023216_11860 [Isoptericola chiayiensis]|uniref:Septum formation-related domain-containing protein n=1 Tax=Isoptericola chiayiensis TaxID=579446 RepID=A0ABP8YAR6_9MICO|nr:septum formation family protein [Isoptericola chiayiensis]NOW00822.1 hypothetical protein [Isoptericola chiayiensis]